MWRASSGRPVQDTPPRRRYAANVTRRIPASVLWAVPALLSVHDTEEALTVADYLPVRAPRACVCRAGPRRHHAAGLHDRAGARHGGAGPDRRLRGTPRRHPWAPWTLCLVQAVVASTSSGTSPRPSCCAAMRQACPTAGPGQPAVLRLLLPPRGRRGLVPRRIPPTGAAVRGGRRARGSGLRRTACSPSWQRAGGRLGIVRHRRTRVATAASGAAASTTCRTVAEHRERDREECLLHLHEDLAASVSRV